MEDKLNLALNKMETEMKTVYEIGGLPHFHAFTGHVSNPLMVGGQLKTFVLFVINQNG